MTSAASSIELASLVGECDIVLITLDALRYDVAEQAWASGQTPHLGSLLPKTGWQQRHTPGTFTLPAHLSFLHGFLPTPTDPVAAARAPRLFAAEFDRARRIGPHTFVYAEADLPAALVARGYRTACFGGVGFFSGDTALGRVLPAMFQQSFSSRASSVYEPGSPATVFGAAAHWFSALPEAERPLRW